MSGLRLNLGCGKDYREDWTNVDWSDEFGADMEADLNEFPYPWEDGSVEAVSMIHVLEHLDRPLRVAQEIYRILEPGGTWEVEVPHWKAPGGFDTWDHETFWTERKLRWIAERKNPGNRFSDFGMNWSILEVHREKFSEPKWFNAFREWWKWFKPASIRIIFKKEPLE